MFDNLLNKIKKNNEPEVVEEPIKIEKNIDEYLGDWVTLTGTYFYFEDGKWGWFKDEKDINDNFNLGTYKVLQGEDAINYVNFPFENVLINMANSDGNISLDNYYAFELTIDECMSNGVSLPLPDGNNTLKMLVIAIDEDYIHAVIYTEEPIKLYLNKKNRNFVKRRVKTEE